jgi:DNA-binding LytR/AlgR family response regulator
MLNDMMKANILLQMPLLEIKTALGNKLIQTHEIMYVKAFNKHSIIFFNDRNIIETNYPLKWYCEKLTEPLYFRSHDSFIVNCLYLNYFCACQLILTNNVRIPLSRYKKEKFMKNLENLCKITQSPKQLVKLKDLELQYPDYQI